MISSRSESVFKGWQLLCVLLITFPPSKDFEMYLRSFIQTHLSHHEGRIDIMAKFSLRRLDVISKKGPRGKPPTISELETASVRLGLLEIVAITDRLILLCRMPPSTLQPLVNHSTLSFVSKNGTTLNRRFPSSCPSLLMGFSPSAVRNPKAYSVCLEMVTRYLSSS